MAGTTKNVLAFAIVIFVLLGVAFGAQIMTFMFAQIGPTAAATLSDESATVTNESGAWLNATTYTVSTSTTTGFSGLTITSAFNATDNSSIATANFSVSGSGFTNASATNWDDVIVSYTYNYYSTARNAVDDTTNNSLTGIVDYSAQTSTQMTTVAIAVTLVILIALFAVFWKFFIGKKVADSQGGSFA